jgi:RNA polymerase sigma-70 factor (ECF subfamily)
MDDLDLLQAYANHGDLSALDALIQKHKRRVFITCWRKLGSVSDAEDASQEVFLALMERSGSVHSNVGAWLHRCALNVANATLRNRRNRRRWEIEKSVQQGLDAPLSDTVLLDQIEVLNDCLNALDADDHQLLLQNCVQGSNQQHIAAALGVSQQTVSKRLSRIITHLRRGLLARGIVGAVATAIVLSARRAAAVMPRVNSWVAGWASTPQQVNEAAGKVAVGLKIATATGIILMASFTDQPHSNGPGTDSVSKAPPQAASAVSISTSLGIGPQLTTVAPVGSGQMASALRAGTRSVAPGEAAQETPKQVSVASDMRPTRPIWMSPGGVTQHASVTSISRAVALTNDGVSPRAVDSAGMIQSALAIVDTQVVTLKTNRPASASLNHGAKAGDEPRPSRPDASMPPVANNCPPMNCPMPESPVSAAPAAGWSFESIGMGTLVSTGTGRTSIFIQYKPVTAPTSSPIDDAYAGAVRNQDKNPVGDSGVKESVASGQDSQEPPNPVRTATDIVVAAELPSTVQVSSAMPMDSHAADEPRADSEIRVFSATAPLADYHASIFMMFSVQIMPAPEPASLLLLIPGCWWLGRRRR